MKGSIELVFNKLFEFQLCSDVYSLAVTCARSTSLSGTWSIHSCEVYARHTVERGTSFDFSWELPLQLS